MIHVVIDKAMISILMKPIAQLARWCGRDKDGYSHSENGCGIIDSGSNIYACVKTNETSCFDEITSICPVRLSV